MTTGLVYEEHTPVVNMVRMTIHYACKNRSHVGRSKSSLQILDHEPPCLLLWQSPMHCAVRYIAVSRQPCVHQMIPCHPVFLIGLKFTDDDDLRPQLRVIVRVGEVILQHKLHPLGAAGRCV